MIKCVLICNTHWTAAFNSDWNCSSKPGGTFDADANEFRNAIDLEFGVDIGTDKTGCGDLCECDEPKQQFNHL